MCRVRKILLLMKTRWKLQKNPVKMILYEKSNKKYLAVVRTNWQGVKWSRHFEIIGEVDSQGEIKEFKSNPIVKI